MVKPITYATIDRETCNVLLAEWGHYLGTVTRPFGKQYWALYLYGEPIAITVSGSIVSTTVLGYSRYEVVELIRLCTHPAHRWATRVALRLWREVAAKRWHGWDVKAAIAYSQNDLGDGKTYRFDGWHRSTRIVGRSKGAGQWTNKRDESHPKTLWIYPFDGAINAS